MNELGHILKEARLKKNLSLEDVSSKLKIQLNILEKIEAAPIDSLPKKTHIKAFIKQYAKLVDADSTTIDEILQKEFPTAPIHFTKPETKNDNNERQSNILWFRAPSRLISYVGLFFILLLMVVIYTITIKLNSYQAEMGTNQNLTIEEEMKQLDIAMPNSDEDKKELANKSTLPKRVVLFSSGQVKISAKWSTGKVENVQLGKNHKHTFYYSQKINISIDNGGLVKITNSDEPPSSAGKLGEKVALDFE